MLSVATPLSYLSLITLLALLARADGREYTQEAVGDRPSLLEFLRTSLRPTANSHESHLVRPPQPGKQIGRFREKPCHHDHHKANWTGQAKSRAASKYSSRYAPDSERNYFTHCSPPHGIEEGMKDVVHANRDQKEAENNFEGLHFANPYLGEHHCRIAE
jgi:hypothetical protein